MEIRTCNTCNLTYPLDGFRQYGKKPDGSKYITYKCKSCSNQVVYGWRNRTKTKDQQKDEQLKYNYGISLVEYNQMSENQNHSCKICSKHKDTLKRGLFVDHCHKTGQVRGLLCKQCNDFIGFAYESVQILSKGIKYLKGEL